jgi:excisionase family DNA binding protein
MSDHHDVVSLTPEQAAQYLGVSKAALRQWRSQYVGPRYFKAGTKLVRYLRRDLDAWVELRMSAPRIFAEQTQMTA